jgi:hypothetical protein
MQMVEDLVRVHNWGNKKYVGEVDGKACRWAGSSINFAKLWDEGRALYADFVTRLPPQEDRPRLFGAAFSDAIEQLSQFAIVFNCDMSITQAEVIQANGFIPRLLDRNCHACIIYPPDQLLSSSVNVIAAEAVRLVQLQRMLINRERQHG